MPKDRVLVVDDDIYMYALIKATLETHFDVAYAESGEACLASLQHQPATLILLDVEMNGMNGYTACRRLQAESTNPPVVIFVSAHVSPEERVAAYDAGADDFIMKPLSPVEIYCKVERAIARRRVLDNLKRATEDTMQLACMFMLENRKLEAGFDAMQRILCASSYHELAGQLLALVVGQGFQASVEVQGGGQAGAPLWHAPCSRSRALPGGLHILVDGVSLYIPSSEMPVPDNLQQQWTTLVQAAAQRAQSIAFSAACKTRRNLASDIDNPRLS